MDRGRRAPSAKINNIPETETSADENCFYFDFGYFCVCFLIKFCAFMGKRRK